MLPVLLIGCGVGFLGGLLGKGGSAIATPLLVAVGVPPIVAVAAPLPATIPGTLVAAEHYRRHDHVDRTTARWAIAIGIPATVAGALLTRWISGDTLVLATDVLIALIGARLLFRPHRDDGGATSVDTVRVVTVAALTGVAAGLLANSGGFLLAPLFLTVLRLPIKAALGTSLAVSAVLAIPGTLVHLALGHIDWAVVVAFGLGSIPLAAAGARLALRVDAARLERFYGAALVVLGTVFLVAHGR